jgi:hypothetical protein
MDGVLPQEYGMATEFDVVLQDQGLPRTGEIVRCKKCGTLWRVMEREVWQWVEGDAGNGEDRVVPLYYFSFWRIQDGVPPRVGQMLGFLCHAAQDEFASVWEVMQ